MRAQLLVSVFLLIVIIIQLAQTFFTIKRRRKAEYAHYIMDLKTRRMQFERQTPDTGCSLYDCYNAFWMRPGDITCSTLGNCLATKVKLGSTCKDCSFDDYKWALFEIEVAETCNDERDAECWKCFDELPNIWDPLALAFDCDTSRLDVSEKCFTNVNDTNCLTQSLDIFDVEPHQIFDAIRYRQNGCPLIVIINQCMEPVYGGLGEYDDISQCSIKKARITEMQRCVTEMLELIPECDISKEVERSFLDSMSNDVHKECKRLDAARDLKMACCSNSTE